jgi:ABC-type antimicrobial peptide transport system permease subunit
MLDFDLKSIVLGAALISVASFKWPGVSVWVNKKVAQGFAAYAKWRAARKAVK